MNRMRCLIGLALLCIVAPGCPSHHDEEDADTRDVAANVNADGSKSVKTTKSKPKSGKAPAAATGPSTEDRLRAFYPAVMGSFSNTGVTRYDEAGENASVGYNYFVDGRETQIAFTAYFYPADKDSKALDDAFKSATNDVKSEHRGVKVGQVEPVTTQQSGETIEGKRVTFRFEDKFGAGQRQPLMSELYVFRKGDKIVKYRITYPAADAEEAQARLSGFISAFPWPASI
jgi:hypothetical protein